MNGVSGDPPREAKMLPKPEENIDFEAQAAQPSSCPEATATMPLDADSKIIKQIKTKSCTM